MRRMSTRELVESAVGETKLGGDTDRGMVLAVAALAQAVAEAGEAIEEGLGGAGSMIGNSIELAASE